MVLQLLLLINGLMEAGLGIQLLLAPESFCSLIGCAEITHASFTLTALMYGMAALSIGLLSLLTIRKKTTLTSLLNALIMFSVFHLGMAAIQYLANPNTWAALPHGVLGIAFIIALILKLKPSTAIEQP